MTTIRDTAAEVAATAEYKIFWLRHELRQAEARGDTKEAAKLRKQLEEIK